MKTSDSSGAHIHLRGIVVRTFTDPVMLVVAICAAYLALNLLVALLPLLTDRITALPAAPACSSDLWVSRGNAKDRSTNGEERVPPMNGRTGPSNSVDLGSFTGRSDYHPNKRVGQGGEERGNGR